MIETAARKNLIAIAKTYAKAQKVSLSAVSRQFYGKHGFLEDFRKGQQSITLSKMDDLLKKFAKAWPDGLDWPKLEPIQMTRPTAVGK